MEHNVYQILPRGPDSDVPISITLTQSYLLASELQTWMEEMLEDYLGSRDPSGTKEQTLSLTQNVAAA